MKWDKHKSLTSLCCKFLWRSLSYPSLQPPFHVWYSTHHRGNATSESESSLTGKEHLFSFLSSISRIGSGNYKQGLSKSGVRPHSLLNLSLPSLTTPLRAGGPGVTPFTWISLQHVGAHWCQTHQDFTFSGRMIKFFVQQHLLITRAHASHHREDQSLSGTIASSFNSGFWTGKEWAKVLNWQHLSCNQRDSGFQNVLSTREFLQ